MRQDGFGRLALPDFIMLGDLKGMIIYG